MRRNVLVASAAASLLSVAVVAASGEFSAGNASTTLQVRLASATRVAAAHKGGGYWLVSSTGAVFGFGTAKLYGSMAGKFLKSPIVGIVATADDRGYWLVAKDGGVFSFGDATWRGSLGNKSLKSPVVGMASSTGAGPAAPGPRGLRGRTGARGARGAIGPRGAIGGVGAKGLAGAVGARGAIGPDGAAGATGAVGAAGANGATGSAGATGATGAAGATGAVGPQGAAGQAGAAGPQGASGAAGSSGARGATGATGAAGAINYAYVFNTGSETVLPGFDVLFNSTGPSSGIFHIPGGSEIQVATSGTYLVDFSVTALEPCQFGVFVNGVPVSGGTYGSSQGQPDTGQLILSLVAGDIVSLNNFGSASSVTLQANAGGSQSNVDASIMIEQIGQ